MMIYSFPLKLFCGLCLGRFSTQIMYLRIWSVACKRTKLRHVHPISCSNVSATRFSVKIITPVTFVRSYARRSARRTAVEEQTQTQTGTQTGLSERTTPPLEQPAQQYQPVDGGQEETTENSLTPDIRRHMTKVYGTMTAGLGLAAVGALVGGMMPGLAMVGMLGSIVGIIGMMFTNPEKVTLRQNLFFRFVK